MTKKIITALLVITFFSPYQQVMALTQIGFDSPFCKVLSPKEHLSTMRAGYEYCFKGLGHEVVNLTQDVIYASNEKGKIYEIEPGTKLYFKPLNFIHIVSKVNGRAYRPGSRVVISEHTNKAKFNTLWRSLNNQIPVSKIKTVPSFMTTELSYQTPIFLNGYDEEFAANQTRAVPAVIFYGIGGAAVGAMGAIANDCSGGDITRAAIVAGSTAMLSTLMAIPNGMGIIVARVGSGGLGVSMGALCTSCHVPDCGGTF
ncbi:hypothetical protein [Vibrio atypicus]|uniref:hypothetical protein n=1 Tax=Vibrio atypicus TaxID=558271 RepID=UPI00135947AC|nr:hypothetical protein [Vibrio atypicus]